MVVLQPFGPLGRVFNAAAAAYSGLSGQTDPATTNTGTVTVTGPACTDEHCLSQQLVGPSEYPEAEFVGVWPDPARDPFHMPVERPATQAGNDLELRIL